MLRGLAPVSRNRRVTFRLTSSFADRPAPRRSVPRSARGRPVVRPLDGRADRPGKDHREVQVHAPGHRVARPLQDQSEVDRAQVRARPSAGPASGSPVCRCTRPAVPSPVSPRRRRQSSSRPGVAVAWRAGTAARRGSFTAALVKRRTTARRWSRQQRRDSWLGNIVCASYRPPSPVIRVHSDGFAGFGWRLAYVRLKISWTSLS